MPKLTLTVGESDHAEGGAQTPCTLVEYLDFECLTCGTAYPVLKRIQRRFASRMRFVFRNFPMTKLHAHAEEAAYAAEYAATHGRYWELHDRLLQNQLRLGSAVYAEIAAQIGLDPAGPRVALDEHTLLKRVRDDFTGGVRSGVNGTPTFLIIGDR